MIERHAAAIEEGSGLEELLPEPVGTPGVRGTRGGIRLLTMLLLLVALLAGAVLFSSLLLPPPPPTPGPFGFAGQCGDFGSPEGGAALEISLDSDNYEIERPPVLHADGTLVSDQSESGDSRTSQVTGAAYLERRLTPDGVDMVRDEIRGAHLTPGCRRLVTRQGSGSLTARVPDGTLYVDWGPAIHGSVFARPLSRAAEAQLNDLAIRLRHLDTWLPPDAWVDATPRRVVPDRWLVATSVASSPYGPGDVLVLDSGQTLNGSDPRYRQIVLPGGAEPATFGELLRSDGGDVVTRCGVIGRDDALLLARSLDSLTLETWGPLVQYGFGEVFTEDLSKGVSIQLQPVYPTARDCAAFGAEMGPYWERAPTPTPTPAMPEPLGDLAAVDPCSLVPADVAKRLLAADQLVGAPSILPIGEPARACVLIDKPLFETGEPVNELGRRAAVTLYPWRIELEEARELALGVLGDGTVERLTGQRAVWENACMAASKDCRDVAAAWSDAYLVFVDFDVQIMANLEGFRSTSSRPFIQAVLDTIDPR